MSMTLYLRIIRRVLAYPLEFNALLAIKQNRKSREGKKVETWKRETLGL